MFASVCYCPVTNLANIDKALEWTYKDYYTYVRPERFGMDFSKLPNIPMDEEQRKHHDVLAKCFPDYVNSLKLTLPDGTALTLDPNGAGTFFDYTMDFLRESVREEYAKTKDLSGCPWTKAEGNTIEVDAAAYAAYTKRVKPPLGYDDLLVNSGENELFAQIKGKSRHFSEYGYANRKTDAEMVDETVMRLMDPMHYFGSETAKMAKHWRLRYGTENRGCSPAITLLLGLKAQENGANVDVALPFGVGHVGNNVRFYRQGFDALLGILHIAKVRDIYVHCGYRRIKPDSDSSLVEKKLFLGKSKQPMGWLEQPIVSEYLLEKTLINIAIQLDMNGKGEFTLF